jgi:hypothetical protein
MPEMHFPTESTERLVHGKSQPSFALTVTRETVWLVPGTRTGPLPNRSNPVRKVEGSPKCFGAEGVHDRQRLKKINAGICVFTCQKA